MRHTSSKLNVSCQILCWSSSLARSSSLAHCRWRCWDGSVGSTRRLGLRRAIGVHRIPHSAGYVARGLSRSSVLPTPTPVSCSLACVLCRDCHGNSRWFCCLTTRCPPEAERAARRAADSVNPVQCLLFVRTVVAGPQLSSIVRSRRESSAREVLYDH